MKNHNKYTFNIMIIMIITLIQTLNLPKMNFIINLKNQINKKYQQHQKCFNFGTTFYRSHIARIYGGVSQENTEKLTKYFTKSNYKF